MAGGRKRWTAERAEGARTFVWNTLSQDFGDFEKFGLRLDRQTRMVDGGTEQDQVEVLEIINETTSHKPKLELTAES